MSSFVQSNSQPAAAPSVARIADLQDPYGFQKHCVFRCGDCWFSMPATAVRELTIAPDLVQVPFCHSSVAGLGHLRSEFIPVVTLDGLLSFEAKLDRTTQDHLLVLEGSNLWALLISESVGLETIETIVSQDAMSESNVVLGTAMYRDRIIRVLNPAALLNTAQTLLEQFWMEPITQTDSIAPSVGEKH